MQNLGWAYSLIPAIKKLYTNKEDQAAALKRHLKFFNTHPYVAAPIMGVTLALEEEKAELQEVVVIGYGTVKKSDATGAVATVSSKDFNKGGVSSPQDLIMCKSAGTVITTSGGDPGAGATIRIRGGSSMSASNDR